VEFFFLLGSKKCFCSLTRVLNTRVQFDTCIKYTCPFWTAVQLDTCLIGRVSKVKSTVDTRQNACIFVVRILLLIVVYHRPFPFLMASELITTSGRS
jgi:hypothetical protein